MTLRAARVALWVVVRGACVVSVCRGRMDRAASSPATFGRRTATRPRGENGNQRRFISYAPVAPARRCGAARTNRVTVPALRFRPRPLPVWVWSLCAVVASAALIYPCSLVAGTRRARRGGTCSLARCRRSDSRRRRSRSRGRRALVMIGCGRIDRVAALNHSAEQTVARAFAGGAHSPWPAIEGSIEGSLLNPHSKMKLSHALSRKRRALMTGACYCKDAMLSPLNREA